jgi:hypothetical protein
VIDYRTEDGSPVVEIHVTGHVTNQELRGAMTRLRGAVEDGSKSRILEVIEHFTGIEPAALWSDIELGVPLASKVTHIGVVADQSWVRAMAHLGQLFTKAEIEIFEPQQLEQARAWIAP